MVEQSLLVGFNIGKFTCGKCKYSTEFLVCDVMRCNSVTNGKPIMSVSFIIGKFTCSKYKYSIKVLICDITKSANLLALIK